MKTIISIIFFFVIFFIEIADVSAFAGGNGTSGSPYQVSDLTELNDVRNYLSSYFIQTKDISIGFGTNWLPIGDATNPFTGSYDGDNYLIMAMYINRPTTDYIGLFGYTYCATLKNITLNDSEINGNDYVGLLVGYFLASAEKNGLIYNCFVHAVSEGNNYVGGLAGFVEYSNVENSIASADVSGGDYLGGLIGANFEANIIYCDRIDTREISGGDFVGGLVGLSDRSSSISNCRSMDATVSGGQIVGGLVGWNNDESSIVESATQNSYIYSETIAGGLVGKNEDEAIIDDESYTYNSEIHSGCIAGGLVGLSYKAKVYSSDVEETLVEAYDYCVGGLIGHAEESDINDNDIYYINVYGDDYVGLMVGTSLNNGSYSNNTSTASNYYYNGSHYGNPFGFQGNCPCNSKKHIINDNVTNETDLQIYPNPAKNYLQINSKLNINNIKIINALGQVIFNNRVDAQTYTVNTSDYKYGIYFIQLETMQGVVNKRFIIGE